jgi:hypothetical protein
MNEELFKQFRESEKEIERLNKIKKTLEKRQKKKEDKIYYKYSEMERRIRERKYKEQDKVNIEFKEKNKQIGEEKKNPIEVIGKINSIINWFDIDLKQLEEEKKPFEKGVYSEGEEIERIERDYLILSVRIDTSGKPVNKYSLKILGFSPIVIYGHSYGHSYNGYLKDYSDKEELKRYWERNKEKKLKNILEKYEEEEKNYKEFLEKYKNDEKFVKLWLLKKKGYYEGNYSREKETEEYAEIIKKLLDLSRGREKQKYSKILKEMILKKLENETE